MDRNPKDKKLLLVAGAGVVGAVIYLLTRKPEEPPPPPPDLASLYGVLSDEETGKLLAGVLVSVDTWQTVSDATGYYEFINFEPGTYSIIFEKAGYETLII